MCKNSHISKLDWDDLRSFLEVARMGRLTLAARRLGLNHSTLSRRISSLEASLKVSLFERSPSGYTITEAGQKLALEVQHMETSVVRIQTQIGAEAQSLEGPIRLTLPEGFATYFFVQKLEMLRQLYPEIRIELIADPGILSLTKREADIAVMMERPVQGPLVSKKLCDYEYGLYCSYSYQQAHPEIKSVSDFDNHIVIGYIPDLLPTPAHDYLGQFRKNKHADFQVSNILTQLSATLSGLGIAILPCFIADKHPELIRFLPDEVSFSRSYWIALHQDLRFPIRSTKVKDFIIEQTFKHQSFFKPTVFLQKGNS